MTKQTLKDIFRSALITATFIGILWFAVGMVVLYALLSGNFPVD